MHTIAVNTNHTPDFQSAKHVNSPVPLSECDLDAVSGGLIFAPFVIAYSYAGAKGLGVAVGFCVGAGLTAVALAD